jgi:outer membrane protein
MKNKLIWIITWITIIGLGTYVIVDHYNKPKTAYIIIQEAYGKFDLKKDLEKKFIATKNKRQKILDSLTFELKLLTKAMDEEKGANKDKENLHNRKQAEFYQRRQTFEQDNNQLSKQYDQEILSQLDQYVSDYGKENHYEYIFGNDGNGSLMHADDALNVTKQVVQYINDRYKGKK